MSNGYPPPQYQQPPPYYPPPMYYPMPSGGGRNWAGIIAGLAALGIGAAAVYWMWTQGWFNGGGGSSCTKWSNQSDCESNGCYWWGVPASCHNAPEGYINCSSCGTGCLLDGQRKCDNMVPSDLCECDASTGNYVLVAHNDSDCLDDKQYLDCFTRPDGHNVCASTVGTHENICYAQAFGYGCPCGAGGCLDSTATCYNGICYKRANGALMNIIESMWTSWENSGGWSATYDLMEGLEPNYPFPFAASSVNTCKIHYKWGPLPFSGGGGWLKGFDGATWKTLWENDNIMYVGDNGDVNIDTSFSLVGIQKLQVKLWCVGTNIKPVYLQGAWYG